MLKKINELLRIGNINRNLMVLWWLKGWADDGFVITGI